LKEVLHSFELTDSRLLGNPTDNASSNYLTSRKVQYTLAASGIELPTLRNYIPCMVYVPQLALGAFMSSLGVEDRTKFWEAHERDQQFGDHEGTDNGKSQRLRTEGNVRMNKVSDMGPGLAKIIEKAHL
jgi:hypothetical protein